MYKLLNNYNGIPNAVIRITDNTSIPFDPDNTDYQEYLEWVADGGVPEEADD